MTNHNERITVFTGMNSVGKTRCMNRYLNKSAIYKENIIIYDDRMGNKLFVSGKILTIKDTTFFWDKPENNLHPHLQIKLTESISNSIKNNNKFYIETHSDHIINGFRIAVKKQIITPDMIDIFHVSIDEKSQKLTKIEIEEDGRILHWPQNFCDEWDKSLDILLDL